MTNEIPENKPWWGECQQCGHYTWVMNLGQKSLCADCMELTIGRYRK